MKPRLFKRGWLWYCVAQDQLGGLGFTPAEAYAEWARRNDIDKKGVSTC